MVQSVLQVLAPLCPSNVKKPWCPQILRWQCLGPILYLKEFISHWQLTRVRACWSNEGPLMATRLWEIHGQSRGWGWEELGAGAARRRGLTSWDGNIGWGSPQCYCLTRCRHSISTVQWQYFRLTWYHHYHLILKSAKCSDILLRVALLACSKGITVISLACILKSGLIQRQECSSRHIR